MSKILPTTEANRLTQLIEFSQLLTDDYLTDAKNIQTKFLQSELIGWRHDQLKLLNISFSLPTLVANILADYVGQPQSELDEIKLHPFVSAFSWAGYCVFKVSREQGKIKTTFCSPCHYSYFDDGSEQLLTPIEESQTPDDFRKERFLLSEVFSSKNQQNYQVERTLYKLSSLSLFEGEVVDLATCQATKNLAPLENLPLTHSPLVVTHNIRSNGERYGVSDLKKIRSLISTIEIQLVSIQDQLLKHLRAKLALPRNQTPTNEKTGEVKVSDLEVITLEQGDPIPQYILNTNPLIEHGFRLIESSLTQVATILAIPLEFFNLKVVGGAEAYGTKQIRISPFLKRVERVRRNFTQALTELAEIYTELGEKLKPEEFVVNWENVFPISKKELAEELTLAIQSALISQNQARAIYNGVDEETAREIGKEIENDKLWIMNVSQIMNYKWNKDAARLFRIKKNSKS